MKLLESPRIMVLVMLLALTGLSTAQDRGDSTPATPNPLFVAKISLFPDNCASPTGNKTITFFAGGGIEPYTYTISSSATIPTTQTQTELLVGTPATFTYAGTGTGDITYTITDEAGTMITGTFDVEEGSFTSGQAEVDICFSPNYSKCKQYLARYSNVDRFSTMLIYKCCGWMYFFKSYDQEITMSLILRLASSNCTYPTSTLKFQMPQISPLSFYASPYACTIVPCMGSGWQRLLRSSWCFAIAHYIFRPLSINNLSVGTYTLGLEDAISTACTQQPPSQQITIYQPPTFVSGYPQATATSCGLNNGTIAVSVTGRKWQLYCIC